MKEQINQGYNGKVYKISNTRCIKESSCYEDFYSIDDIEYSIKYIINHRPSHFVRVYDFNIISNDNERITFSYEMDICESISDDEFKVFHSLISHEDFNIQKSLDKSIINNKIKGLKFGLDFDEEKVKDFCNQINTSNIKHLDLHPRNVMKDSSGNFKLVDLDNIKILKE